MLNRTMTRKGITRRPFQPWPLRCTNQARMNLVEDKIVHLLTGKSNLREVTVGELEAITQEQPFFSIAQLLLAKKMKQENHPAFQQQVARTALYFPNTYWLDSQLQDREQEPVPAPVRTDAGDTVIHTTGNQHTVEVTTVPGEPATAWTAAPEEPVEENSTLTATELTGTSSEEALPGETETAPETAAPVAEVLPEEPATTVEENSAAPVTGSLLVETTTLSGEPQPQPEEPVEEKSAGEEASGADTTSSYEQSIRASFQETAAMPAATDEDNLPVEEIGEQAGQPGIPNMKLAEILQQQAEAFHKTVEPDAEVPVSSEPYHTIDYFASQGIKLDNEASEGDALGKKVRKFTDWLKQMKRINPADLGTDKAQEQAIQGIAAHSIEEREVVTEPMAEVLVKQGKIDKAIQVYSKLSFLNPDKSAYFASKILALKET